MHNDQKQLSIRERVEAAIAEGSVRTRPRWVVAIEILVVACTAVIALLAALLAVGFVSYSVIESGEAFLLGFGWEGIRIFLMLFPWMLVLVTFLLIAIFQWRLSYILPSYRIPFIPLFVLLLAAVIGVGYLSAPLHSLLSEHVDDANVPVLEQVYERVYESREGYGVYRGVVVSVEDSGFRFIRSDGDADEDDAARLVISEVDTLEEGNEVFIFGEQRDGVIHAANLVILNTGEE